MAPRGPRPRRKFVVPVYEMTAEEKTQRDLFRAMHDIRGFARMEPEQLREVSSKGGKASGGARRLTPEERREMGRRGGYASGRARRGI